MTLAAPKRERLAHDGMAWFPFRLALLLTSVVVGALVLLIVVADISEPLRWLLSTSQILIRNFACRESRLPTPYPSSFSVDVFTNISRPYLSSFNTTTTTTSAHLPLRSKLYYDWSLRSQLIRHPPGSYECVHFYNTTSTQGCDLIFVPLHGMYRVIVEHGGIIGGRQQRTTLDAADCCLDIADLGAPPPDWARQARPTYRGQVHDAYAHVDAYEFVFDHGALDVVSHPASSRRSLQDSNRHRRHYHIYDQFHTARETEQEGWPLVFTFPGKAGGRQDYHFDTNTLVLGRQPAALFHVPDGCELVLCNPPTS